MNKRKNEKHGHEVRPKRQAHRVRVPGFLVDDEVGLGDVLKRATYAIGFKPCGGCEKRAEALNRWMVFSR